MTDFFADLEQELRGAHPRRPKPVVPVRAVAVAAAVLSAVIVALGTLAPSGEREVAQQPPPLQDGWTAYAPLDTPQCDRANELRTVGDRVPDALVERFAVLRAGDAPPEPVEAEMPEVQEIYGSGVRVVHVDASTAPLAILPVRLGCPGDPGELGMCLVRLSESPQPHACAAIGAERDFIVSVVDPVRDGVAKVGVLASDSALERVEVRGGEGRENRSAKWNLVVAERRVESPREVEIDLGDGSQDDATFPLNCADQPELRPLKDTLAIFREPPADDVSPFEAALPRGYHSVFLTEARAVEFGANVRYVVFPAGDATCGTGVCLVREGNEQAACGAVRSGVVTQLVTDLGGGEQAVAAIISDGVDSVTVRSPDAGTTEDLTAPAPRTSVFYSTIETDRPREIEVVPGS